MRRTASLCPVFVTIVALTLSIGAPAHAQHNPVAEKAAQQTAKSWLALTDTGKYAESWNAASDVFKKAVTRDKWVASVKPVRDPLGKVQSRKPKLSQYAKDPAGAPKGEYVTMQFDTSFEKKPGAVETLAEMRDKDGKWRVAGYFIK